MHNRFDQFAKNILRDALGRAAACANSSPGTTSSSGRARAVVRTAVGSMDSDAGLDPGATFPALVIISPGRPETALRAFGCHEARPGEHHAVGGLLMRVVVLAELPRTRDTLLLRLLGSGRLLADALTDLAALPDDAWEKSVASPLLIHFRLGRDTLAETAEDDVNAEIREWWERYQQNERDLRQQARDEGRKQGERAVLLRQLRARFGELPVDAVTRIDAAGEDDLVRWSERVLGALSLDDALDGPS